MSELARLVHPGTNATTPPSRWHAVAAEAAVRFLPSHHRPRFREEWGAALDEIGEAGLPVLPAALRIIAAAPMVGLALRRGDERHRLAEQIVMRSRRTAFVGYDHRNVPAAEALKVKLVVAAGRGCGYPNLTLLHSDYRANELNKKFFDAFAEEIATARFYIHLASPESASAPNTRPMIEHWLTAGNDPRNLVIIHVSGDVRWDEEASDFDWDSTTALPRWMSGLFETRPHLRAFGEFSTARASHDFVYDTLLRRTR